MRPRVAIGVLLALLATAAAATVAGCGEEEHTEVVEGLPIELAGLEYNVQITRFLNPHDAEDSEYLVGLPEEEPGTSYLGIFMVIENESEEALPSASQYTVFDTTGEEFEPVDSESPYALDIGADVPGEGQLPLPDTTAATGPNKGALLIFPVRDEVSENRPLNLEISSAEGSGEVILDI